MSVDASAPLVDELTFLEDGRRVSFTLDTALYPPDAVFGAAYLFLDRAFVLLQRPADGLVEVRLKPKAAPADAAALEALAGEFANALLDQVVRARVAESTGKLREYAFARAFLGTPVQSSIDQLLAELDAEELEGDDLEIQVPWEQGE
jgi:His-Xaa-Ser system protein HxsD